MQNFAATLCLSLVSTHGSPWHNLDSHLSISTAYPPSGRRPNPLPHTCHRPTCLHHRAPANTLLPPLPLIRHGLPARGRLAPNKAPPGRLCCRASAKPLPWPLCA
jgi:hypothetical protein